MSDIKQKISQVKQLKLKFALNFLVTNYEDLSDDICRVLDNQLQFLDGLEKRSMTMESISNDCEEDNHIVHSWLTDVSQFGKNVHLQATTPHLWTSVNDSKKSYLYGT